MRRHGCTKPKFRLRISAIVTGHFGHRDRWPESVDSGTFRHRDRRFGRRYCVDFQFRDIRGKAATDTGNLAHSQKLLGHKNRDMTEHYVKARMGERVKPLR